MLAEYLPENAVSFLKPALSWGDHLLILTKQILLDMHEVPYESTVKEGHTGPHLKVHLAHVRSEGCGVK